VTAQKYFLSEENIFFQKPLPGPSAQIFVIPQKIELPIFLAGAAAPPAPRLVRLCPRHYEAFSLSLKVSHTSFTTHT